VPRWRAVRSLFGFAKKHGLIFANPARRLKADAPSTSLLPMDDTEIRAVKQVISSPACDLLADEPEHDQGERE